MYLANLRDRNEVLFYRLLSEHISEMLPVVYTPTVGLAIERFSNEFRRPRRAVYLSVDHPEDVETSLRNAGLGAEDVDLLVATDSEGILGIGDQGIGGIEISIGKLALYTAAAGIHPRRVIPVVLDVGTDNLKLLNDDMYLGVRHARVRDQRYDDLIDAYVTAVTKLFPHAMLHWEDFGTSNARRILERYADHVCTFNDDMQGTAAVVLAAAFSAVKAAGTRMRDQRVVIHGAGTAGIGIADMMRDQMVREGLSHEEATRRFWALGRSGLLTDDRADKLYDFQVPYARPAAEVAGWASPGSDGIMLADVVARARPTMLIGTSTQRGAFTEAVVREMAQHVDAADHHAAVEPDLELRGRARGPHPVDRRPRADRHREPVPAGHARRRAPPHRPGQQRAGLPRPRARGHRRARQPDHRPDDRRRRRRRRVGSPTPPRPVPRCCRRWTTSAGCRPPSGSRSPSPRRRRGSRRSRHRPDPAGARGHVAARVPAHRSQV